jgi:predicted enzyme related to lactoylglutathione lyase
MAEITRPTVGNGKICYLEIPALDIGKSSQFYQAVFDWHIRRSVEGRVAFDDGVGEVSGTWVTGRPPSTTAGIVISIMVDDIKAVVESVAAHGGRIVQPIGKDAPELTAWFTDPAGNLMGLYQEQH